MNATTEAQRHREDFDFETQRAAENRGEGMKELGANLKQQVLSVCICVHPWFQFFSVPLCLCGCIDLIERE